MSSVNRSEPISATPEQVLLVLDGVAGDVDALSSLVQAPPADEGRPRPRAEQGDSDVGVVRMSHHHDCLEVLLSSWACKTRAAMVTLYSEVAKCAENPRFPRDSRRAHLQSSGPLCPFVRSVVAGAARSRRAVQSRGLTGSSRRRHEIRNAPGQVEDLLHFSRFARIATARPASGRR